MKFDILFCIYEEDRYLNVQIKDAVRTRYRTFLCGMLQTCQCLPESTGLFSGTVVAARGSAERNCSPEKECYDAARFL